MKSLALHSLSTTPFPLSSRNSLRLRSNSQFQSPLSPLSSPILRSSFKYLPFKSLKSQFPPNATPKSNSSLKPPSPPPIQGAKPIPFAISIAIGLIVRFLIPKPIAISPEAWQLLSIFLSTIAGLVLSPLPVGAWAFLGLTTSIVTKTLSFSTTFSAFTNEVIWLIVISFFFARGFVKTEET